MQRQLKSNKIRTAIGFGVAIPLTLVICEGINNIRGAYQSFREREYEQAYSFFYHQSIPTPEEQKIMRESLCGMRGPDSTYLKLKQLGENTSNKQ